MRIAKHKDSILLMILVITSVIASGVFLSSGIAFGEDETLLLNDFNEGDEATPLIVNLVPLFENKGVDLYVSGHYHCYERNYVNGIYYLVSSGGGAPLHDTEWRDYTEFNKSILHHCLVDAGATEMTVTAYDNGGNAFDSFVIPKGSDPGTPEDTSPSPPSGPPPPDTICPYLQDVTQTSIKVMWITEDAATSRVDYGLTDAYGSFETDAGLVTVHEIALTGLGPNTTSNTTYHYKVTSGGLTTDDSTFKTAPSPDSGFTFIVYGDNRADGMGPVYTYDHEAVCNSIAGHNPETMILHTGDYCLLGTEDEWGPQFFQPARDILKNTVLYPVIGNHTYDNKELYEAYFEPPDVSGSGSEFYYSFNYGNTHFVALDAFQDFTVGSDQYNWLVADLESEAATGAAWIVVSSHTPIYSSQSRHMPNGFGGNMGPFQNSSDESYCYVYYEYDPAIVLGGSGLSLKLDYHVPLSTSYSGMWTALEYADLTGYNAVSFWVRGADGGENFELGLKDSFGFESKVEIADYLGGGASTSWKKVIIPFEAFTGVQHWDDMDVLSITFKKSMSQEGRLYIDDIQFEIMPTFPSAILMIDNYNDGDPGKNTLGFWTGSGGPGLSLFQEVYLHRYNEDALKNNNAKKITYDCGGAGDYAWYSSNVESGSARLDISDYEYLSFRLKRESGNESCYLKILYGGGSGTETPPLYAPDYFIETDEWQLVNVPLDDFVNLDKTKVKGFIFFFDNSLPVNSGTLYIDNLELSKGAYGGYGKPESAGPVRIERGTKSLFVNDQPFGIKGVGYQPVPIGQFVYPPHDDNPDIYERDFGLLGEMGCNAIRLWATPFDDPDTPAVETDRANLFSKAEEYGLMIIAGFWMDIAYNYTDPDVRDTLKQEFTKFVNAYKDSPALLVWALGNENNYHTAAHFGYYSLCNELAEIAYQIEGASYHPVIIVNGNLFNMGVDEKGGEDLQLNFIDAWGCNVYLEHFYSINWLGDIRNFFELYKEKSAKPIIITEYGADAFRTTNTSSYYTDPEWAPEGYEDQDMQADRVRANILEFMTASDVCLGASVMEYSDEWWKDPAGSLSGHDLGGFYTGDYSGPWGHMLPDDYANEEWWGIVEIAPDGTWETPPTDGLDDIKERKVYHALKDLFTKPVITLSSGDSIQDAIDSLGSGGTVYLAEGSYGEDPVIAIGDDVDLIGEGAGRVEVEANIISTESPSNIARMTILYPEGCYINFDSLMPPIYILADAGITAIDSEITIRDCIIMPDLDTINFEGGYDPPLEHYGKGIQIWNLYGNEDIEPVIENNLILNPNTGIYLFSQAFGGAVLGGIKNNTLDLNNHGITLRMHNENPVIENNIFTRSQDAIHLAYDSLLQERLANIANNCFGDGLFDNTHNVWCDALGSEVTPTGIGNIYEDPEYLDPLNLDYYPQNPNCDDKGYGLE